MGIFDKGVKKTNRSFFERLSHAVVGRAEVDDDVLDAIEEALLATDMGVDTTMKIIENLEERVRRDKYVSMGELVDMLREEIGDLLNVDDAEEVIPFDFSKKPYVIMVVGVNGVGKTTTIGKLASSLKAQGKKVVLGAADTFRAAAEEQLDVWSKRAGVEILREDKADSASLAFRSIDMAREKGYNVVIIDSAGRLQNKFNLIEELKKIKNVIYKKIENDNLETLLVLDGSQGQNGLNQALVFNEAVDISAIAITKLDGTPKGGIIFSIAKNLKLPTKLIGVGEGINDVVDFNKEDFINALFE